MESKLLNGDNIELLKELEENSVDSIVTDPPYGLSFMNKKWDYDVPSIEFWTEALRVLKPGGHVLSFGGTRTYHRMVVNMEDAGFEIRDQIQWIYGSGFPKSHNIGKAYDKRGGNQMLWFADWLKAFRKENDISQLEISKLFPSKNGGITGCVSNWELGKNIPTNEQFNLICEKYNLPFNKIEELEREVVGKKTSGIGNAFGDGEWNTGEYGKADEVDITKGQSPYEGWGTALKPANEPICLGRKPFKGTVVDNVIKWETGGINIDECKVGSEERTIPIHSDDKKDDTTLFGLHPTIQHERIPTTEGRFPANVILDEEAGEILDKQSGISKASKGRTGIKGGKSLHEGGWKKDVEGKWPADNGGGASRFFYNAKVSKKERNKTEKNNHPTIKPVSLMAYLCKLITPKGGVVLDPFMGSGSTGISAMLEDFNFIGMEMDEEYFKIAEERINNYEEYREFVKK